MTSLYPLHTQREPIKKQQARVKIVKQHERKKKKRVKMVLVWSEAIYVPSALHNIEHDIIIIIQYYRPNTT